MKNLSFLFAVPFLAALVACSGGGDELTGGLDPNDPNNPNNPKLATTYNH
jgi:hypothetical protein